MYFSEAMRYRNAISYLEFSVGQVNTDTFLQQTFQEILVMSISTYKLKGGIN